MRCPRSVTGLIDRAERRGLVRRRSTPADGRAVLVSCTTEGRRLIDQVGPTIIADVQSLGSALDATERVRLTELVRRVVSESEAVSTPVTPTCLVTPRWGTLGTARSCSEEQR